MWLRLNETAACDMSRRDHHDRFSEACQPHPTYALWCPVPPLFLCGLVRNLHWYRMVWPHLASTWTFKLYFHLTNLRSLKWNQQKIRNANADMANEIMQCLTLIVAPTPATQSMLRAMIYMVNQINTEGTGPGREWQIPENALENPSLRLEARMW